MLLYCAKVGGTVAKKSIPVSTAKMLYANSAGLCCICKAQVVIQTTKDGLKQIGAMAHIAGENAGSARYDEEMTDEQRYSYDNLMLLCPNCHATIDNAPESYSVKALKDHKQKHEAYIKAQLFQFAQSTSFAELEVLLDYVVTSSSFINEDLTLITPKDKIHLNSLESVSSYIEMGLLKSGTVADYLNRHPEPRFSKTIKGNFTNKYIELKDSGMDSKEIFFELWDFAANCNQDFALRAAGLAILTYLFEICEVFEKC